MDNNGLRRFRTISEFHESRGLPKPQHPLISVIDVQDLEQYDEPVHMILDYYSISLKRDFNGKFKYGQYDYDFDEGVMYFIAPNQVFKIEHGKEPFKPKGWLC